MYNWIVFLHVVGAFFFVLAHGTSATVAFVLRGQRQPRFFWPNCARPPWLEGKRK